MTDRICSVEGCGKPHLARGWCSMHYARWCRNGVTDSSIRVRGVCAVDCCEEPHSALGWCKAHYSRWTRTGDPIQRQPRRNVCYVDGCGTRQYASGWCSRHYRRWKKTGDPLMPVLPLSRRPGCSICHHDEVDAMEAELMRTAGTSGGGVRRAKGSVQRMSAKWNVSPNALDNHARNHMNNSDHAARCAAWEIARLEQVRARSLTNNPLTC